jgi:hypothetical protein
MIYPNRQLDHFFHG